MKIKKVCLFGTESVGKSTMLSFLTKHYDTVGVPEMARAIIEGVALCTKDHLYQILDLHSQTILEKIPYANRVLFVDTDIFITNSYCNYLFDEDLLFKKWHLEANSFDLYLYLDKNVPLVQDGTRLNYEERNKLDDLHRSQLEKNKIPFIELSGTYHERFEKAILEIDKLLKK